MPVIKFHKTPDPTNLVIFRTDHARAKSLQPCLTFCNTMNCTPPDSSVHEILQARILEWVARSPGDLPDPNSKSEGESRSVVSNSLQPHGLYSPWNSPGQNTGVGSLSLLQQIFTTQESNPGLPHCKGTALMSPALASGFFTTSANW